MTEPLLFGHALAGDCADQRWLERDRTWPVAAGLALAAACLTRYEAWPITAATIVVLSGVVLVRRGSPFERVPSACAAWQCIPAIAVVLFLVNSRWTVGCVVRERRIFRAGEHEALGHPLVAWEQVAKACTGCPARRWSGPATQVRILIVVAFVRSRQRALR